MTCGCPQQTINTIPASCSRDRNPDSPFQKNHALGQQPLASRHDFDHAACLLEFAISSFLDDRSLIDAWVSEPCPTPRDTPVDINRGILCALTTDTPWAQSKPGAYGSFQSRSTRPHERCLHGVCARLSHPSRYRCPPEKPLTAWALGWGPMREDADVRCVFTTKQQVYLTAPPIVYPC